MKLVWNAIVRNEAAIIERCVNSLLPHVDGAVIVDTGSSDGTPERISDLFRAAGKPVQLAHVPFQNFEQARNAALRIARESTIDWDYLLLADADMELKVHKQPWLNGEKGLSYDLKQRGGALGYYNRRLVSRDAKGWYVGVTHEYLDVPSAGIIDAAEFVDHADGANRPGKVSRDIDLLEAALATETRAGLIQRYHFYLAASFYDSGEFGRAAEHYKIRVGLGGFDEEVWYAQYRYALCLKQLGDRTGFLWEMLRAYELRPQRAESLHDLAKYFRESGANRTSILFSEPGLQMRSPSDLLFVDNYIHNIGLKEEFAICAYYDPGRRKAGARVCDELVLTGSGQARSNMYWYLEPLVNFVPSFQPKRMAFDPPAGWVAMNPSIVNDMDELVVLLRTVNYTITPEGQYEIRGTSGTANSTNPIHTRNYLVYLDDELNVFDFEELQTPSEWPAPKYDLVIGFEDSRLFVCGPTLWTISTVRELNEPGLCQQVVVKLNGNCYDNDWFVFESDKGEHEKNWMPWPRGDDLQFVYRLGSLVNAAGGNGFHRDPKIDVSRISGGSQVIIAEGINIALVHEANTIPGRPHNRFYQHRFVTFADDGGLLRISRPFFFHDRQIEFAAGLAYVPQKRQLVASYGIRDCEAWLATMDFDDVIAFIAESGP